MCLEEEQHMIHISTEHPVTCEIPDAVGETWWYNWFLKLHGNHLFTRVLVYMLASLCSFYLTLFFFILFLSYPVKIRLLLGSESTWTALISTYCCPLLSGSRNTRLGFWSPVLLKLRVPPCLGGFEAGEFDLYPYSHYDISKGCCARWGDKRDFLRWLPACQNTEAFWADCC